MNKAELIKELEPLDDDAVVIIQETENSNDGWTNIGRVVESDSQIAIVMDFGRPFSSD